MPDGTYDLLYDSFSSLWQTVTDDGLVLQWNCNAGLGIVGWVCVVVFSTDYVFSTNDPELPVDIPIDESSAPNKNPTCGAVGLNIYDSITGSVTWEIAA